LHNNIRRRPIPIPVSRRVIPAPRRHRLIPVRDMAGPTLRRHPNKRRSRPRLAQRWFGNPDTGAGADTAGCGCLAVMSPALTRARIGFPVTGPNDTADGSGCRNAGDDIGRLLMGASRSPRLPLLAIAHPPPFLRGIRRLARKPAPARRHSISRHRHRLGANRTPAAGGPPERRLWRQKSVSQWIPRWREMDANCMPLHRALRETQVRIRPPPARSLMRT
jgi:hypothetical protein